MIIRKREHFSLSKRVDKINANCVTVHSWKLLAKSIMKLLNKNMHFLRQLPQKVTESIEWLINLLISV